MLLVGLLSGAAYERFAPATEPPPMPLLVRATARDYHWHFTLAGPDGRFGTTDDQIDLPNFTVQLQQPVRLEITSEDYLYTLRAPALGLKEVAMPGLVFTLAFTPTRAGRFALDVDPMCGAIFAHDTTMGWLEVTDHNRFRH